MIESIILDTETNSLNGLPIQISYIPCSLEQGDLDVNQSSIFDQLFNCGEKIEFASMAVHHIIESDLIGKPAHTSFKLPSDTIYIIGHNIQYDIRAIEKCGVDTAQLKPICTLALARRVYPEVSHKLGALAYMLTQNPEKTREVLKNAHDAKTDILLTAALLRDLIFKLKIRDMEHLYEESCKAMIPEFINFGKHKGTAIKNLPIDYVRWLQLQDDLDQYLRIALRNMHGELP